MEDAIPYLIFSFTSSFDQLFYY